MPFNQNELKTHIKMQANPKSDRFNQEHLILALRSAALGAWEIDLETGENTWDQGTADLLGIPADQIEVKSKHWTDYIHPEDRDVVSALFRAAGQQGTPYSPDFRVVRTDGAIRWFNSRGVVVTLPNGRRKMVGIVQDITESKAKEEVLRESEERLRVAQELSPDGFTIFRPLRDSLGHVVDFMWVYENAAIAKLNRTDPVAVVGRRLLDVLPSHADTPFHRVYQEVAASGNPMVLEAPFLGETMAEEKWFRVAVVPMKGDIAILAQDITERKQAEEALRRSEGRWNAAIENFSEGAIIATEEEQVIHWNPAARRMHGFTSQSEGLGPLTDTPLTFELWTPDGARLLDLDEWPMRRIKRGEPLRNLELRLRRPDQGWEKIVSYSGTMVETAGGERLIFLSVSDLTEQRRAEAALRESGKRFELLATVTERLLKAENPQVIVEDLCRLVMQHIDCQYFFNYLVEVPGKQMHLNACAGISKEAAESIRQLDFGVAVCGCVARDCQRIIAEDIQNSNDLRTQLVRSFGVQAYCCHPLMMHGRLIGTLSFGTKTRPTFTADEVALMKSVCDQVAVAMQRLLSKTELSQLNESLEQRVVERTKLAEDRAMQLRSLAVEMIEVEERERRRFADLLHDDLQQMLASARFQLQAVSNDKSVDPVIENVSRILEESLAKSRRLTHELSPPIMHYGSLSSAIEWLAGQMKEHFGLNVHLEAENMPELKKSPVKVFVFRAVQELLFNIAKHSGVKNASVLLSGKNSHLDITVTQLSGLN